MVDEATRNRILERWQARASGRAIAQELGVSRSTVREVLRQFQAGRNGDEPPPRSRSAQQAGCLAVDDRQPAGAVSRDHREAGL